MAIVRNRLVEISGDINKYDFNRLYIFDHNHYGHQLSKLFIRNSKNEIEPLTSVKALLSSDGRIYFDKDGINYLTLVDDMSTMSDYIRANIRIDDFRTTDDVSVEAEVPSTYEATSRLELSKGNDLQPQNGIRRVVSVAETNDMRAEFVNNNYVLLQLVGYRESQLIKRTDIYYYDGETRIYPFMVSGKVDDLVRDDIQYFVNGVEIENLFVSHEYSFDSLLYFEQIDAARAERHRYEVVDGADGLEVELIQTEDVDAYISEQTPAEDNKIKIKNFKLSANGEYINVYLRGSNIEESVKITDLLDENGISLVDENGALRQNLLEYVGRSLRIRVDAEHFIETEPLTSDQAQMRYETVKSLQPTEKEEDVLADGTFVKLDDGRVAEEKMVAQPISYNFAQGNEEYSAYLCLIGSGESQRFIVMSRQEFEERARGRDSFTVQGQIINVPQCQKLKRAKFSLNADIVQTTNTGREFEECKLLNMVDGTEIENKTEELERQREAFLTAYKAGQYKVGDIIDENGKVVKLKEGRFRLSDEYVKDDVAATSKEYEALSKGSLKLVGKDGKLEAVKGGPKYDVGKSILKKYGTMLKSMGIGMAGMISIGGLLLAPLMPIVAPVLAAAAVGGVVGIPAYCAIKGRIVNGKTTRFPNPVDVRRSITKAEVESQLSNLYEQTNSHMATQNLSPDQIARAHRIFLTEMQKIDLAIMEMSAVRDKTTFKMEDGECKYDARNAYLVDGFRQATQEELAEVKSLEAQLKVAKAKKEKFEKAKAKIEARRNVYGALSPADQRKLDELIRKQGSSVEEYETLQSRHDELQQTLESRMKDHTSQPQNYEADPRQRELMERAKEMKGFMILKHFNQDNRYELEPDEIELLQSLEYDAKKGVFVNKESRMEFTRAQVHSGDFARALGSQEMAERIQDVLDRLEEKIDQASAEEFDINSSAFRVVSFEEDDITISRLPVESDPIVSEVRAENTAENTSENTQEVAPEVLIQQEQQTVREERRTQLTGQIESTQSRISSVEQAILQKGREIDETRSYVQFLEGIEVLIKDRQTALGESQEEYTKSFDELQKLQADLAEIEERIKLDPSNNSLIYDRNAIVEAIDKQNGIVEQNQNKAEARVKDFEEAVQTAEEDKHRLNIPFANAEEAREHLANQEAEKASLEAELAELQKELDKLHKELSSLDSDSKKLDVDQMMSATTKIIEKLKADHTVDSTIDAVGLLGALNSKLATWEHYKEKLLKAKDLIIEDSVKAEIEKQIKGIDSIILKYEASVVYAKQIIEQQKQAKKAQRKSQKQNEQQAEQTEEEKSPAQEKFDQRFETCEAIVAKFESQTRFGVNKTNVSLLIRAIKNYIDLGKQFDKNPELATRENKQVFNKLKNYIKQHMHILTDVQTSWQNEGNKQYAWLTEDVYNKICDNLDKLQAFSRKQGMAVDYESLTSSF